MLETSTLAELSWLEAIGGSFERARALLDAMATNADELGATFYIAGCGYWSGEAAMLEGSLELAEEAYERGAELLEGIGERLFASSVLARLGECRRLQGDLAGAIELTERVEAMAADGDIQVQSQWRSIRAETLVGLGSVEEGRRLAKEAAKITRRTEFFSFNADAHLSLARVERAAGERDRALGAAREALGAYEAKGNVVGAGRAREVLDSLGA